LLIWIHVDDVFLHGPSEAKVIAGLNYVMETALRLGLICQPVKTRPPCRIQKFCGLLYDTRRIPTLRILTGKILRAKALIHYLHLELSGQLARLTLAVVTGVLQSLVPATPANIGATFLHHLYKDQARQRPGSRYDPRQMYGDSITLSDESHAELAWWDATLFTGLCRES